MRTVDGKVALITGAGSGIGRAIGVAWTRRGGAALLVGRRWEPLEATASECLGNSGCAWLFQADITSADDRRRLQSAVQAQVGSIDVLVHSAALLAGGAFASHTPATIEQVIAINLSAPLLLTREWLPTLQAQRGGIIVVGSLLSGVPLPGVSLYAPSKGALRTWALALSAELSRVGVHVLVAHPPGTRTPMTAGLARAFIGRARLSDPADVGERIIRAWEAERREVAWGASEWLPGVFNRLAPGLFQRIVRWQAQRLERLFGSEP